MKLIYIASPYHADTPVEMEKNRQNALEYCERANHLGKMVGENFVPVTPLVNFPYLNENDPTGREQALMMGLSFLSKCDELWVGGDRISEGMKGEIRAAARMNIPILSMGLDSKTIQAAVFDMPPMLIEKNCYKNSDSRNYNGQLLVLKESALAPWAKEPENQLWIGTGGFGVNPSARGRAVYATNLFDGTKARWDRQDFYGIANPNRLPGWAADRLSEHQQHVNNDEETEENEQ